MPDLEALVAARAGRDWCLFLDRDGVVNRRVEGGYVRSWDEFEWLPGAKEALVLLGRWAPRVVVLTNQQGVGKGLMTAAAVDEVHERLRAEVAAAGGRIDAVEVCPHLESERCSCRKPEPGMALRWLAVHPGVDASLSVMAGDSDTDIEMAERLASRTGGCASVRIGAENSTGDLRFASLTDFAAAVEERRTGADR